MKCLDRRSFETDASERSDHAGCEELSGCEECEMEVKNRVLKRMICHTSTILILNAELREN